MPASVLYMSMSLDGFITGPDDDIGHGLGLGGERLHHWLAEGGEGVEGYRPREIHLIPVLLGDGTVASSNTSVRHTSSSS